MPSALLPRSTMMLSRPSFLTVPAHQLTYPWQIGFHHLSTLGLAYFLHDHLLGGLRSNAAELHGRNRLLDDVAERAARPPCIRFLQSELSCWIPLRLLIVFGRLEVIRIGNRPAPERVVLAGLAIDGHAKFGFVVVALLGCHGQRGLYGTEDHVLRHAFFVGYRIHDQQHFSTHKLFDP
jgi:hypothetical protein